MATPEPVRKPAGAADAAENGRPGLEDREFEVLCGLLRDTTGISVSDTKRHFVRRRLAGRLSALGCETYGDYLALLEKGDRAELEQFTNAMTTNQTSFFREKHHFDYLGATVLPEIRRAKSRAGRRLRIWSAGCSTGQEPYSIAMVLREQLADLASWDARILCTDLDTDVLRVGRTGVFTLQQVESLPATRRRRWFQHGTSARGDVWRVRPELRQLTAFRRLNLLEPWPMRGPFDAIFCRNVFIYFERPTQLELVERFADMLVDDGALFLGHSESLLNASERFRLVGRTVYRKVR